MRFFGRRPGGPESAPESEVQESVMKYHAELLVTDSSPVGQNGEFVLLSVSIENISGGEYSPPTQNKTSFQTLVLSTPKELENFGGVNHSGEFDLDKINKPSDESILDALGDKKFTGNEIFVTGSAKELIESTTPADDQKNVIEEK